MIGSFRNFAKTKFAGILVFIMIIPFVFWGMGSMFSSGNTNNIAKINKTNISTQEFLDYLNNSGVPQEYIRENLDKNIIQELLSGLISSTLLKLEILDLNIIISENTLLKKIKDNKNFLDENGIFQRIKYEKFLLENNQTAAGFEQRLKERELQKNLFDFIGAGTTSPKFLIQTLFEEENKKLNLEYINLEKFYDNKENISNNELNTFIKENEEQLKIEFIDFSYVLLNPKNLMGIDEFNQSFFDKIDQIEIDISNEIDFETIISKLNLEPINITNFSLSENKNEIEKKIFNLRANRFDLFENNENFILYNVTSNEKKKPDIENKEIRDEILEIVQQKKKYEYNQNLFKKIKENNFNENDFLKLGQNSIQSIQLNSIKDNNKFEINAVELLYSLPENSFTLINDEKNNVYLAKIINFEKKAFNVNGDDFQDYMDKQNSQNKQSILKTYDLLMNDKYDIVLNQKTIERVNNFFK